MQGSISGLKFHCNRELRTELQYSAAGRCKVHLCESACACETMCCSITRRFTRTCTLTQVTSELCTFHLPAVQYKAPYCSVAKACMQHVHNALRNKLLTLAFLQSESRLHIAIRDNNFWRPSRATLIRGYYY